MRPLLGVKRTWRGLVTVSANDQKRTSRLSSRPDLDQGSGCLANNLSPVEPGKSTYLLLPLAFLRPCAQESFAVKLGFTNSAGNKRLTQAMANEDILIILEQRLGLLDARQRLGIGKD